MYKAEDILEAREKRVNFQNELMDRHKRTICCIRVNYPGVQKTTDLSINIFNEISVEFKSKFKGEILTSHPEIDAEGPVAIYVVDEKAEDAKRKTMDIEENHPLGRFVDIDVYDYKTHNSISRTSLGKAGRKCYICNKPARECVRNMTHSQEEIIAYMNETYRKYRGTINE